MSLQPIFENMKPLQKKIKLQGELTGSTLIREAAERSMKISIVPATSAPELDSQTETSFGSGLVFMQELQPGLRCELSALKCHTDLEFECKAAPLISCNITLEGSLERPIIRGQKVVDPPLNRGMLTGFGEPTSFTRHIRAGQYFKTFAAIIQPVFFERFENEFDDEQFSVFEPYRKGCRMDTLPHSQRLVSLAHNAFNHTYNGSLVSLYQESNTLQFLLEVIQLLSDEGRLVQEIGRKHYDRLLHARSILDRAILTPPKTLDLARQVGTNINTLQAHFKLAFGTTIFSYVKSQRLEMARVLLRDHNLGSAETGYRVGFSSPAAFAASYRSYFGHPPTTETRC